jgi:hypothetical protein
MSSKISEETGKRMSEAQKKRMAEGKWTNPASSKEARKKMSEAAKKRTKEAVENGTWINPALSKEYHKNHPEVAENLRGKKRSFETLVKMSDNRKGKGCYPRSEVFKRNLIKKLKGKSRPDIRGENNPAKRLEVRKKISENNPMYKEENKKKISEYMKVHSIFKDPVFREKQNKLMRDPKRRALISGKNSKFYGKSPPPGAGRGKGSWYIKENEIKIWLRSTYETRFVNCLAKIGIEWKYEVKSFSLEEISPYHPDFYLLEYDLWIEIKGYMRPEAKEKLNKFFIKYSNVNLRIVRKNDIERLEEMVKNNIDFDIRDLGNRDTWY